MRQYLITTITALLTFACADLTPNTPKEQDQEPTYQSQEFSLSADGNLSVQQGEFSYLDSYVDTYGETYGPIAGRGQMVRYRRSGTTASVSIAGLPSSTFFAGHLHRAPCADNGGAHLQDPSECPLNEEGGNSCEVTYPGTELWTSGTTDASGRLVIQGSAEWSIPRNQSGQRASDLSIVIHDTPNNGGSGAGPKMLCVDLAFDRTTRGVITYVTPNLTDDDRSESVQLRKAYIKRNANGSTIARLGWSGLRPNFKYPSHIHAARCSEVSNGGPHYVRDIDCIGSEGDASVGCVATTETEFWSGGISTSAGKLRVKSKIDHLARAGALSLVLHECLDNDNKPAYDGACAKKPRFACVDFY